MEQNLPLKSFTGKELSDTRPIKEKSNLLGRLRIGLIVLLSAGFFNAHAQYVNVPVTGYNADLVANGTGTPLTVASVTADLDASGTGFAFIDNTFHFSAACTQVFTAANVLPPTNLIASTVMPGFNYQLQSYSGNNALRVPASGVAAANATLTVTTPVQAASLNLLCVSGGGAITNGITITVTFTDATVQLFSNLSTQDWCNTTSGTNYTKIVTPTYYRAQINGTCATVATCQYFAEMTLPIAVGNYGKQIASINIAKTTAANAFSVFAVAAVPPCAAPAAQATALSLAPTIGSITGSFTAATGAPTGYLVVRYPTGAATTAPSNGTTYTANQVLGAGTVLSMGAATTINATGLTANTGYDFYVYAYNNTACVAGPIFNTTTPLAGTATTSACGILSGVVPVGPTAPASPAGFASLTQAMAYISNNGLGGSTILELQSDYVGTSATETFPIIFPVNACIGAAKTLTIRPAAGATGLSITNPAATASATFSFNGATYVTIDGRPGGVGGAISVPNASYLTISNTGTAVGNVAIKMFNEANHNTIKYCDVQGANGTNASFTDCGVILIAGTTGTAGNDNNTIDNCNIHGVGTTAGTMSAIDVYSYGYNVGTISATSTFNDNNTVSNCNIYDFFAAAAQSTGVKCDNGTNAWTITNNHIFKTTTATYTGGNTHRGLWITPGNGGGGNGFTITNNFIGGNSAAGTGNFSITDAVTTSFYGMDLTLIGNVQAIPATATLVQGNTITNIVIGGTTTTGNDLFRGISTGSAGDINIINNTIGATTGNGAITLNSGNGSTSYGFKLASAATIVASNNNIGSITLGTAGNTSNAMTMFGIATTTGTTTTLSNNLIGSLTTANSINAIDAPATGTTVQAVKGISIASGATSTVTGNTVANLNNNYASTTLTGASVTQGIIVSTSTTSATITANTVRNLTTTSGYTGSGSTAGLAGIIMSSNNPATVSGNTIYSLVNASASTTAALAVEGIVFGSNGATPTNQVYKNIIHSLDVTAANTSAVMTGIDVTGGSNILANNMVRLGITPAGTSNTNAMIIRGLFFNTTTNQNVYYNSIYIGGTGVGTTTGKNTFAFNRNATSGTYDIRNNIFVNNRSNASTGSNHFAEYFTTSATGAASNYNLYLATGTGGLMGFTGSANQTAYASGWIAGDVNSQSGDPLFIAPTDPAATVNLHLTAGPSLAESNGIALSGFNDDIDGDIRQGSAGYTGTGTAPDLGADEFAGTAVTPVITAITPSPTGINCTASVARTITAAVTANGAAITAAQINYSVNGVAQTAVAMTLATGTGAANSASTYTGTIPVVTPANATVAWSVTVTTASGSVNKPGTTYSDVPLTGVTAAATAAAATVCTGTADALTGIFGLAGTSALGTATGTNGSTSDIGAAYPIYYGNGRQQYLILASEMTALGFTAGNITSMGFTVGGTVGNPATLNGYSIKMAATAVTTITTFQNPTFTSVWGPTNYTPTLNALNTHTFTTPFVWDGTSNILVDICFSNQVTGNGAYLTAQTSGGFNCSVYYQADGAAGAGACTTTTVSGTSQLRPNMLIGGNKAPALTYSWSDGTSVIGTTKTVTATPPTGNTTYTVTGTQASSGCGISASTAVTGVPGPTQPTATNSSQCGTQLATASVASTSGAATPTFNWYNAATSGTLLQSSTSTTYTTALSATTTFYVTETNGTCESFPRVPITVTVSIPDAVSISGAPAGNSCINAPLALTAVQTGSTNTYTFTWSSLPASGSGVTGTATGASQTFTPTVGNTYAYTVTANDPNGCATTATVSVPVLDLSASTFVASPPACLATTGSIAVSAVNGPGVAAALNSIYTNNFTSATLTAQASITGSGASITGGQLQLTPNTGSLGGGFLVLGNGANPSQVQVDYDFTTSGTNCNTCGADGYSWSFGDDVVALPTAAVNGTDAEQGSGSKVKVAFDAYGSTDPAMAGIYLMYNCTTTAAENSTGGGGVLAYSGNLNWKNGGTQQHITISINPAGQLTLSVGGTTIFNNVQLPAAYISANKSSWKHAFAGRTGGVSESHLIDNLNIQYNSFNYEYSADGTTWASADPITGLAPATYPVYIRYQATPSCFFNLGNAVIGAAPVVPTVSVTPTSATYCAGQATPITLTASGATTYSWSPSTGLSATTGATVTAAPTTGTVYTVTGSNGCTATATATITYSQPPVVTSVTSTPASGCSGNTSQLQVNASAPLTSYCVPSMSASNFHYAANFALKAGATSIISNLNHTSNGNANAYTDYGTTNVSGGLVAGTTYTVTENDGSPYGGFALWIDYDQNGIFDNSELVTSAYTGDGLTDMYSTTFTIPTTAFNGLTKVRLRNAWATAYNTGTSPYSCSPGSLDASSGTTYGETQDYTLSLTGGAVNTAALTYSWTPSGNLSSATVYNPTATLPTVTTINDTTVYTVTTTYGVCSVAKKDTLVTFPIASPPTAANSSQCGYAVPTASVTSTSGISSPVFHWYNVASGGSVLQSGPSNTFINAVDTTTIFYVAEFAGVCESNRTPVTVTVSTPDALHTTANASTTPAMSCVNLPVALNYTQTGTNSNNYSLVWTASPQIGSGIPSGGTAITTGQTLNVTPTAAGVYTYMLTGTDGGCAASNTVTITINDVFNGVTATASATPGTVCAGTPTSLSVLLSTSSIPAAPAATSYCTSTHTSGCSGDNVANVTLNTLNNTTGTACGGTSHYTYFNAGGTQTTTLVGGTTYSLSITVGTDGNQYEAAWIDYNHDGVYSASECVGLSGNAGGGGTATISFTVPAGTAYNGLTHMRVIGGNDNPITNGQACGASSSPWGETQDYDVTITGAAAAVPYTATTPTYSWSDGTTTVGTANPQAATPTGNTTYTVTASNNGCSITASTAVTANPVPTAPTANNATQCGVGIPTASVTSTSGLPAPTFKWYAASTGGTALQSSTSTTFTTSINTTTTYYVTEANATGCESFPRTAVTETVTIPDAVSITGSAATCNHTAMSLTAVQTGSNGNNYVFTWSANPGTGSGVSGSPTGASQSFTPTVGGNYTYAVTAFESGTGCTQIATLPVSVLDLSASTFATTDAACSNLLGSINVTGNSIPASTVYANDFSTALGTNATVGGNASMTGGLLVLTPAVSGQIGGLTITNSTALSPSVLTTAFDFAVDNSGGTFGTGGADGFSYNFSDDGTYATAAAAGEPELGTGSKLRVVFEAASHDGNPNGIYLLYGYTATTQPTTTLSATVLGYSSVITWKGASNNHVAIVVNSLGQATVTLNGTAIFTNVQLPTAYTSANKATWKHIFTSRTGGDWERHALDNLNISYSPYSYQYSIDGTNWQASNLFAPTPATYPVSVRYLATPACPTALGNAVIGSGTPAPTVTNPPATATICAGNPINLSVTAANGTYQWKKGAANVSNGTGGTTASYTIPTSATTDAGSYTIVASGTGGCVGQTATSTACAVTVNAMSTTLAGNGATASFVQYDGANYNYATSSCQLIASVSDAPGGNVLNSTNATLAVDGTVQMFNGAPYLQRHADINPASSGAANVTMYFLQSEFDTYNSVQGVGVLYPKLPTGPTDVAGKANIRFMLYHGLPSSGTTGPGGQYDITNQEMVPNSALTINWTGNYWAITFPVTNFSGIFMYTSITSSPLNVTLKDISATNLGPRNRIDWSTESEQAGTYFDVERSLNGSDFTKIGTVTGNGNASDYVYYDEQPANGVNYYRLRIADQTGNSMLSKTVQATVKSGTFVVEAFPNPVHATLTVNVHGDISGTATLSITDIMGKTILQQVLQGTNAEISTDALPAGVYFLKYDDDSRHQSVKLTKQ